MEELFRVVTSSSGFSLLVNHSDKTAWKVWPFYKEVSPVEVSYDHVCTFIADDVAALLTDPDYKQQLIRVDLTWSGMVDSVSGGATM